jgi:Pyruvate/2-oxoacid:ferredoxin oxidoreductase gamma subunit
MSKRNSKHTTALLASMIGLASGMGGLLNELEDLKEDIEKKDKGPTKQDLERMAKAEAKRARKAAKRGYVPEPTPPSASDDAPKE